MSELALEPDAALVAKARNGDREAFGALVERHQSVVCAIAYSHLGDLDSAHDVAQEVFLAGLENLRLLRSASKFGSWLGGITRRLCKRWQRSESYRRALRIRVAQTADAGAASAPIDVLIDKEDGAILRRAVERLPGGLREALVLHYFRGHAQKEAAGILGISRAAFDKRLERAKRRLRGYLSEELEARLGRAGVREGFARRVFAAVPTGSVCGKLSLHVGWLGWLGAVHGALQETSAILAGGAITMVTKKAIVAIGAAVLILLSGGTAVYLVSRSDAERVGIPKPISPRASAAPGAAPSHATPADLVQREVAPFKGKSFASSSETAKYVADLLLYGLPDVQDQSTREQILRIVIRDIFPTYLTSWEAFGKFLGDVVAQGDFPLAPTDTPPELLPLFLAFYDVLSRPEVWPLVPGLNSKESPDALKGLGQDIVEIYKKQGRLDDATAWLDGMISTLTQQLAGQSGATKDAISATIAGLNEIKDSLAKEAARDRGEIPPVSQETAEMEAQLQRTRFESPAQEADFLAQLGDLYKSDGQYAEALQHYNDALKLRTGDSVFYQRIAKSQTEVARAFLTPEERATLAQSKNQLRQIGLALRIYATDNQGRFPESLQELADKGYAGEDPSILIDPMTKQPYIYTPGLTKSDSPFEIIVRSAATNHLYNFLYVDGVVSTLFQPE